MSSISLKLQHHNNMHSSQQKMDQTTTATHNQDLNFMATELRLGLPGSESPERTIIKNMVAGAKRGFLEVDFVKNGEFFSEKKNHEISKQSSDQDSLAASKAQVVGWPPIRSFRKNSMAAKHTKNEDDPKEETGSNCVYVKVSMDGAPYLRKVDLKMYTSYSDLSSALEKMFSSFTLGQYGANGVPARKGLSENPLMDLLNGSEYVLTYEDKDGDLMLVGDVPWDMFTGSCKRMRIMKSSDAIGLAPRAMEKRKGNN